MSVPTELANQKRRFLRENDPISFFGTQSTVVKKRHVPLKHHA